MEKFKLGTVVATPPMLAAFEKTGEHPAPFVARHVSGDWGDLSAHDRRANEAALKDGSRIWSVYKLKDGQKFYIITAATDDNGTREYTTLMLPEDY